MPLHVTPRDLEILIALHTARYLTTDQVQRLFWRDTPGASGPRKACERRLRKLRESGLIRHIEQPVTRAEPSKPYIYTLDKQGAEILVAELGLNPRDVAWKPMTTEANYPFLAHLLATTDLRIALLLSCERNQLQLEEWLDEKVLKSENMRDYVFLPSPDGQRYRTAVVPDALFVLKRGDSKALFFVEVDQSTVTIETSIWQRRSWTRKVQTYLAYFDSDPYRNRFGARPARVLTVTTSAARREHLKQATEREGGDRRFRFAIFGEASDPDKVLSEKIWHTAGSHAPASLLG